MWDDRVIVLVSRRELRATPSAPALGEGNVWGTNPKLLYPGNMVVEREREREAHNQEEETREDSGETSGQILAIPEFWNTQLQVKPFFFPVKSS